MPPSHTQIGAADIGAVVEAFKRPECSYPLCRDIRLAMREISIRGADRFGDLQLADYSARIRNPPVCSHGSLQSMRARVLLLQYSHFRTARG